MKELMIHVERVVRPLPMSERQKLRIREELLGHLRDTYHEELDRLHDRAAAVHAATERFGDTEELSRKLQSAVPWYDFVFRWPCTVPHLVLLIVIACITIELPAVTILGGLLTGQWFGYEQLAVWGVVMTTLPLCGAYVLGTAGAYHGVLGHRRSLRCVIGYSIACYACLQAGSLLMHWPHPVLYVLYPAILTGILAAGAIGMGQLIRGWERRVHAWGSMSL